MTCTCGHADECDGETALTGVTVKPKKKQGSTQKCSRGGHSNPFTGKICKRGDSMSLNRQQLCAALAISESTCPELIVKHQSTGVPAHITIKCREFLT